MKKVFLKREYEDQEKTLGKVHYMKDEEKRELVSLELPWRDINQDGLSDNQTSRIPSGNYRCEKVESPKFGHVYEVTDVENGHREKILIHGGNVPAHTHGCILLGLFISDDKKSIISSQKALAKFMNDLNDEDFELIIEDV